LKHQPTEILLRGLQNGYCAYEREFKGNPMTMMNQASVEIDRPIHDVFDYTINNVAEWSRTVLEDIPIDTKPDGGVGSTFRCLTGEHGRQMEFQGTVTKHEPPLTHAVEMVGSHFDIDVLYVFEDLDRHTRVTQVSVVTPKGFFMKLMFKLMSPFTKKAGSAAAATELQRLKQYLEGSDRKTDE
jgi:hypothetical protein